MSGECERCGEHTLECRCLNESVSCDIQSRLAPVYEKYKDYPDELLDAFQFFIEAVDNDQYSRFVEKKEEKS